MPVDEQTTTFLTNIDIDLIVKGFLVLFLIFYVVFSLILFRQIQLMAKKLPTTAVPILKFAGILLVGVSLALLFIVIGIF